MTLSELLPTIQSLPRADKLRLIQLLAADVARDDGLAIELAATAVPIWSPYDSFQGAAALLRALDEDQVVSVTKQLPSGVSRSGSQETSAFVILSLLLHNTFLQNMT